MSVGSIRSSAASEMRRRQATGGARHASADRVAGGTAADHLITGRDICAQDLLGTVRVVPRLRAPRLCRAEQRLRQRRIRRQRGAPEQRHFGRREEWRGIKVVLVEVAADDEIADREALAQCTGDAGEDHL